MAQEIPDERRVNRIAAIEAPGERGGAPMMETHSTLLQDVSHITSIMDKSADPSPSLLSSNASASSSTTPLLPEAQPIPPLPQVAVLAHHGIKVRDFAYEGTLPPIAPYRYVPRPVQHGPRPLKRSRFNEYDVEGDPFQTGPSTGSSQGDGPDVKKSKPLERKVTEPAVDVPPLRTRGFLDLSSYEPSMNNFAPRRLSIFTPSLNNSQQFGPSSQSQSQPPLQFTSQDSEPEPCIDTPTVTPNGSLHWPSAVTDTSSIPASQLDTPSQAQEPELVSFSQLGFRAESESQDELLLRDTSPIQEPPPHSPRIPSSRNSPDSVINAVERLPPTSSAHDPLPPPVPSSPRYSLRKRASTAPSSSRTRSLGKGGPKKQLSFAIQSAHSKKQKSPRGVPRKVGEGGEAKIVG